MLTAIALVLLTPLPDLGRGPRLSDLRTFPNRETTNARCRALQREECRLRGVPDFPGQDKAIRQNKHARDCWEALQGAQDEDLHEPVRRECLEDLYRLIGDVNYRRGLMP